MKEVEHTKATPMADNCGHLEEVEHTKIVARLSHWLRSIVAIALDKCSAMA